MPSLLANNFLEQILKKEIDFDADVFKIALVQAGFVFNRATHATYSDISASEVATAFGYIGGGATLAGVAVAQDDVNNAGVVTWSNASWTAGGGNITASGAIIYDNTHASKPIVGYIDFGGAQTCLDGGVATVANPKVMLRG